MSPEEQKARNSIAHMSPIGLYLQQQKNNGFCCFHILKIIRFAEQLKDFDVIDGKKGAHCHKKPHKTEIW